jgi:hypothetical protein
VNDRTWIALLAVFILLASTATSWFRFRSLNSMRPWLVRHVIGNFVLAVGLVAAWFFNVALFYYAFIVVAIFVMRMGGNSKLRGTVPEE